MLRRGDQQSVEQRLIRLERRLEDTEDMLVASLAPDRVDDLAMRVDELSVAAVTHDDLLQVRVHAARLAAELTRVRAELAAEIDLVSAALDDLAETGYTQQQQAAG